MKRGTHVLIFNSYKKIAKSKRSISSVIATVLLVLIATIAIVLIWVFLKGFLKKSSSGVETSCLTLDLVIEKAEINASNNIIYVKVKRNPGEGNLSGIRFRFTNSTDRMIRDKDISMQELETKTFSFNDVGDVSDISKVEIAPLAGLEDEQRVCRISDSKSNIRIYISPPPSGNIYYVSKLGNDNNPGTEESPWLTIQKAANSLIAGDRVYIKEGTYEEYVHISISGEEGKRITFSNFENDKVNLVVNSCHGFYVLGDYITIRGFNITNAYPREVGTGNCNDWTASGITSHRSHGIFENNEISNSMYGILIRHRTDVEEAWPTDGYNIVKNNYIHHTNYTGIRVKRSNHNILDNNRLYYNHLELSALYYKEGGIFTYAEASLVFYCLKNLTIINNVFYEPGYGPVILEVDMVTRPADSYPPSIPPSPDITKCYLNMDEITIKNNIGYQTLNTKYHNILVLGRDFALGSGHDIDYNVWYNGNPNSKIIEWGWNFGHDNDGDDGIMPSIWTLQEFQQNTGYDLNSRDTNPF